MFSTASAHQSVHSLAQEYSDYTIALRRHIHQYPELGWEEDKTISMLMNEIEQVKIESTLDFEVHHRLGGFFIDVNIDPSLPRILFRADLDALPIDEKTDLPFASKFPNRMHACGHDCHAAMLMGAFKALARGTLPLKSNLRLVFQRAEELGPTRSGGRTLGQEGV